MALSSFSCCAAERASCAASSAIFFASSSKIPIDPDSLLLAYPERGDWKNLDIVVKGHQRKPLKAKSREHSRGFACADKGARRLGQLRKKLRAVDDSFDMIEALYGVGYRFKEL
jgi:hypothetical protein